TKQDEELYQHSIDKQIPSDDVELFQ
ncbi:chemotaxis protein CheD, partial [Vibrio cholerae]|nr:chemotaxis protein CheD [Vibrio cholerae]